MDWTKGSCNRGCWALTFMAVLRRGGGRAVAISRTSRNACTRAAASALPMTCMRHGTTPPSSARMLQLACRSVVLLGVSMALAVLMPLDVCGCQASRFAHPGAMKPFNCINLRDSPHMQCVVQTRRLKTIMTLPAESCLAHAVAVAYSCVQCPFSSRQFASASQTSLDALVEASEHQQHPMNAVKHNRRQLR